MKRLPYRTVYITMSHPPGAVFQGGLLDNQEGANSANSANNEPYVFGKLSARCFQRRPFWRRHCSNCGRIEKSSQGCVIYTVLYGRKSVRAAVQYELS